MLVFIGTVDLGFCQADEANTRRVDFRYLLEDGTRALKAHVYF